MKAEHPLIGVCGISCRVCSLFHAPDADQCRGCKAADMMKGSCLLPACAMGEHGVEFCWECPLSESCEEWRERRAQDSVSRTCAPYQRVEENLRCIQQEGIVAFETGQMARERLLREVLRNCDDGGHREYFCGVTSVLEIGELEAALTRAWIDASGFPVTDRCDLLRAIMRHTATSTGRRLVPDG